MLSRDTTSRGATVREVPELQEVGILHIDPGIIPFGFAYKWARLSVLGEPDDGNWARVSSEGWRPVPADRHPELVPPPIPGRQHQDHAVIIRAGQILMERPIEMQRAYLQGQRAHNRDILSAVDRDRRAHGTKGGFVNLTPETAAKVERRTGEEGTEIPQD